MAGIYRKESTRWRGESCIERILQKRHRESSRDLGGSPQVFGRIPTMTHIALARERSRERQNHRWSSHRARKIEFQKPEWKNLVIHGVLSRVLRGVLAEQQERVASG